MWPVPAVRIRRQRGASHDTHGDRRFRREEVGTSASMSVHLRGISSESEAGSAPGVGADAGLVHTIASWRSGIESKLTAKPVGTTRSALVRSWIDPWRPTCWLPGARPVPAIGRFARTACSRRTPRSWGERRLWPGPARTAPIDVYRARGCGSRRKVGRVPGRRPVATRSPGPEQGSTKSSSRTPRRKESR